MSDKDQRRGWRWQVVLAVVLAIGAGVWFAGPQRLGQSLSQAVGRMSPVTGTTANAARPTPTVAVEVATARQVRTTRDIRAIGSLMSDETVLVAPEIAGRISEIVFEEGRPVRRGDVILKLDDALTQAELIQAKARLTLAAANNDRATTLGRTGAVTGRSQDEAQSAYDTAAAEVSLAETRLSKQVLKAPFDGIVGFRNVSVGSFVNTGVTLVNVEKIDILKVDFKIPEIFLTAIEVGQDIEVEVDPVPDRKFAGKVYAINPMVDVNGRAVSVRAKLDNRDLVLRPGLFARITIKGPKDREVILIPEAAVVPKAGETFVFRVDGGAAIESRVQLGERSNAEVEVLTGLIEKSVVVTAGQQKLRNGTRVEVVPTAGEAKPAGGAT
jgi:membrane fusion protein (multidrug efflux system)